MAVTGTFKVATDASIRARVGKSNELLLKGLQSTALPIGFTMNTITVSSMGEPIDHIVPTGGQYDEISVNYNFVVGDPSQTYLMQQSLRRSELRDMRFYIDDNPLCGDFVTVDLISDPAASYRIGTFSAPEGSKNELFTGTVSFLPGGASALFIFHANGTDLVFTSGAAAAATIASTTQDFTALGFASGQTIILDHVDSLDPLHCQIDTVTTNLITLVDEVGDNALVPAFNGVAATAIHSAEPMVPSGYDALEC